MNVLETFLINYFEQHPDQVANLLELLVNALITHLKNQSAAPAAAK